MIRLQRNSVIVSLIQAMKERDSWCAETNVQKACYFLQELTGVPLDLEFVLYKYGPYSFDLTDELTAMRADRILALRIRDPRYGPCYVPGELAGSVLGRFPNTLRRFEKQIEFVAERFSQKGVAELERLATALYVHKTMAIEDKAERAKKIIELKPHISLADASAAVQEVDAIAADASALSVTQ
jgi:hypothetical protein